MKTSEEVNHSDDQLLWEKMKVGNDHALGILFKRHYPLLYNYGMKFSHQAELVKDCIQEVFAYIWEKKHTVSHVSSVGAYLLTALRRQLLKSLEQQRKRHRISQEYGKDYLETMFSAEDLLIMNEEQDAVKNTLQTALHKIPSRMREALYLKMYSELSYKEIAAIMEIDSQVARNYVSQAFHRLRGILALLICLIY
ncbi:ECF RNA polymerase sigma factor RpoE [bacterium BMS3Abin05]|nr:ECF RNA polymerase sigma factor RpoE [bacterium BMS3Abin05]